MMEGFVDNTGAARLRMHLDPASTKVLLGRKTPEEIAAEKEARAKAREEKAALERAERAKDEAVYAVKREEIKAQRAEIENADKLLAAALDTYQTTERAIKPTERETARARFLAAEQSLVAANEVFERARKKAADAATAKHDAAVEMERLESFATAQLPAARDGLKAAWEANEKTWAQAGPAKRKAGRDRKLRNRVKVVLSLKSDD